MSKWMNEYQWEICVKLKCDSLPKSVDMAKFMLFLELMANFVCFVTIVTSNQ